MVRHSRSAKVSPLQTVSAWVTASWRPEAILTLDRLRFDIRSNGTTGVMEQRLDPTWPSRPGNQSISSNAQRGRLSKTGIRCSNLRQTATGATFAPNDDQVIDGQPGYASQITPCHTQMKHAASSSVTLC